MIWKILIKIIKYYILDWKPIWYKRILILFFTGGILPVFVHLFVSSYGYNFQRSAEITFLLMIPVAAWMAHKIAIRWHDDEE